MSARYDLLFKKYAKKLDAFYNETKKDDAGTPISQEDQTKSLFEKLWALDPTQKKTRAETIIQWYCNDPLKDEDLYKITENLEFFESHKHLFSEKDLMKFKTYNDFFEMVYPVLEDIQNNQENALSENQKDKKYREQMLQETTILEETETYILLSPKTEEASCYWGRGTQWCTAATTSRNYFEDYHQDGSLYIVLEKKTPQNQKPKKYQFHLSSTQFMNVKDQTITPEETKSIESLYKNYPESLLKKYCDYFSFENPETFSFKNPEIASIHYVIPEVPKAYKHLPIEEITRNHIINCLQPHYTFLDKPERISHLIDDEIENLIFKYAQTEYPNHFKHDQQKIENYILHYPQYFGYVDPENYTVKNLSFIFYNEGIHNAQYRIEDYYKLPQNSQKNYQNDILQFFAEHFPENFYKIFKDISQKNPQYETVKKILEKIEDHNTYPYNNNIINNIAAGSLTEEELTEDLRYYRPDTFMQKTLQIETIVEKLKKNEPFPNDTETRTFEDDIIGILKTIGKDTHHHYPFQNIFKNINISKNSKEDILKIQKNLLMRVLNRLSETPLIENQPVIENIYSLIVNYKETALYSRVEPDSVDLAEKFIEITEKYLRAGISLDFNNMFAIDLYDDIEKSTSQHHKDLYKRCTIHLDQNKQKQKDYVYSLNKQDSVLEFKTLLSLYSKEIPFSKALEKRFFDLFETIHVKDILQDCWDDLKKNPDALHLLSPILFDIAEKNQSSLNPYSFPGGDLKKLSEDLKIFYQNNLNLYTNHLQRSLEQRTFYGDESFSESYNTFLENILKTLSKDQQHKIESALVQNFSKNLEESVFLEQILDFLKEDTTFSQSFKISVLNVYSKIKNTKTNPDSLHNQRNFNDILRTATESSKISTTDHIDILFYTLNSNFYANEDNFLGNLDQVKLDLLKILPEDPNELYAVLKDYFKHHNEKTRTSIPQDYITLLLINNFNLKETLTDDQKKSLETLTKYPLFSEESYQKNPRQYYQDRIPYIEDYSSLEHIAQKFIRSYQEDLSFEFVEKTHIEPLNRDDPDCKTFLSNLRWTPTKNTKIISDDRFSWGKINIIGTLILLIKVLEKDYPDTKSSIHEEIDGTRLSKYLLHLPDDLRKKDSTIRFFIDSLVKTEHPNTFYKKIWENYYDLPENQKRDILRKAYQTTLETKIALNVWKGKEALGVIPAYFEDIRDKIKKEYNFRDQKNLLSLFLFSPDHQGDFEKNINAQNETLKDEKHNTPTWILPIQENSLDERSLQIYKENPKIEIVNTLRTFSPEQALTLYKTEIERILTQPYSEKLDSTEQTISKIGDLPLSQKTENDLFDLRKTLTELLSQKDSKDFTYKALKFLKENPMSVKIKTVKTQTRDGDIYTIPEYIFKKMHSERTGTLLRQYPYDDEIFKQILKRYETISTVISLVDKLDPVSKILFKNLPENNTSQEKCSKSRDHEI